MNYTNTITKIMSNPIACLEKVENNHGDIYWTIRVRACDTRQYTSYSFFEFNNESNAREYFMKHCFPSKVVGQWKAS